MIGILKLCSSPVSTIVQNDRATTRQGVPKISRISNTDVLGGKSGDTRINHAITKIVTGKKAPRIRDLLNCPEMADNTLVMAAFLYLNGLQPLEKKDTYRSIATNQ